MVIANTAELASLNDYPLGDRPVSPTGQFLDSFYVADSPLTVTYIAELAILNDYPLGDGPVTPTGQFK